MYKFRKGAGTSSKNHRRDPMKRCEDCDECVYICEGDFVCLKGEPKIILVDFSTQTDDYGWCMSEQKEK